MIKGLINILSKDSFSDQLNPLTKKALEKIVTENCIKYDLDEEVVYSIIWQESKGVWSSWRFEEKWFSNNLLPLTRSQMSGYVPKELPSLYDEKVARSCSYGYMHILGETARSFGQFKGDFLIELVNPIINIELGCRYLSHLINKNSVLQIALAKYNGSFDYPPLIMKHIESRAWEQMFFS